jgi:hypothetical protein
MLIGSCSITKRRYNTGWHIEWNKKQHNSSNKSASAENNNSVQLDQMQTQDSIAETTSIETPIIIQTEPIQLIEESSVTSSTEDACPLNDTPTKTASSSQNNTPENSVSGDEPKPKKRTLFPNSKRVFPIPIAIILSLVVLAIGIQVAVLVGFLFFLLIDSAGFTLFGGVIGILLGSLIIGLTVYSIIRLFDLKESRFESEKKRKRLQILISLCIAVVAGIITSFFLEGSAF